MKKEYWYILIGVAVLIVAGIGYWFYKRNQSASTIGGSTSTGGSGGGILSKVTSVVNLYNKGNTFPLQQYSSGSNVTRLQVALNKKGETLVTDGKFGAQTKSALIRHTGHDTITEAELIALEQSAPSANNAVDAIKPTPVAGVTSLDQLTFDLLADLDAYYMLGRGGVAPYTTLYALNDVDLKTVAAKYKSLTPDKTSLYADIDSANFKIGATIDKNIMNRLKALGIVL